MSKVIFGIGFNKLSVIKRARELVNQRAGIKESNPSYEVLSKKREETLSLMMDHINLRGVHRYTSQIETSKEELILEGIPLRWKTSEKINSASIKGAYVFNLTVGDFSSIEGLHGSFIDLWGTALVDSSREAFLAQLKRGSKISSCIAPGYYGMEIEEIRQMAKLLPFGNIDVKITSSMCMIPEKSACGIFLDMGEEEIVEEELGASLDLGTTTLVFTLCDLKRRKELERRTVENPQKGFGNNVLTRITYIKEDKERLYKLRNLVIEEMNAWVSSLNISPKKIKKWVVCGNPTMTYIFLGQNLSPLMKNPIEHILPKELTFSPSDFNLHMDNEGVVEVLPLIGGHVGGDILASIVGTGMEVLSGNILMVDIGTNGEMVLKTEKGRYATSTAAGPVFEGGSITKGVGAKKGAISHVKIEEKIELETIEDGNPIGICGSGLVDAIGEMRRKDYLSFPGRLLESPWTKGDPSDGKEYRFILSSLDREIHINQMDIRQVQMAKGAIMAGIKILCKEGGISVEELDAILLTGTFGNHMNSASAINMGLIPPRPLAEIHSVDGGAAKGATTLLEEDLLERARELAQSIVHVELGNQEDFQTEYIKAMDF